MSEMEVYVAVRYFVINWVSNNYSRTLIYNQIILHHCNYCHGIKPKCRLSEMFRIRNTTDLILLPGRRLGV